jgi:hypothetical protein
MNLLLGRIPSQKYPIYSRLFQKAEERSRLSGYSEVMKGHNSRSCHQHWLWVAASHPEIMSPKFLCVLSPEMAQEKPGDQALLFIPLSYDD